MATKATHSDFERRRRERRRRERIRKKRIRAAILLIALIGIIVIVCAAISTCKKKDNSITLQGEGEQITEATVPPAPDSTAAADAVPTALPVSAPVSNIPPASEENDLMTIIRNSSETKYCYLTFDDGPTENITPQILDTLRRYNVKATFFEIGSLIKTNSDMARRVYEEGHLIANHSDGHNYAKLYVSTETFMNEVNSCYEAIKEVTGEEPFKLVRFPGGSFKSSADSYSPVKQECKEALKAYGFYHCDWNALNGDAEGKTKDADELLDYMITNLDGEDNVVVLMHDAAAKQATADALPSIIEYFIDHGYTFHRLDDIEYGSSAATTGTVSSQTSGGDSDSDDIDSDDSDNSDSDSSSSGSSSSQSYVSPAPRTQSTTSTNSGAIIIQ